jgi:hypothetical protein
MRAGLIVAVLASLLVGCSKDPESKRAIHIRYEFRLEDDRDSLSTELDKGHYEVRIDGECSAEKLVFTTGGVFETEHKIDDLVQDGLRVKDRSHWRIRQHDGHRMIGCRGVVLYPDGVKAPPTRTTPRVEDGIPFADRASTSTTERITTTTEKPTPTTVPTTTSPPVTRPPATTTTQRPPPPPSCPGSSSYTTADGSCISDYESGGDVDCGDLPPSAKPVSVHGEDYYDLDRDHDGTACDAG